MKTINVSFKESQRFNQWWLHLIMIVSLGVMLWAIYASWDSPELKESSSATIGFWLSMTLGFAVLLWVWLWKLETKISNYGIEMICWPVKKKVSWNEIEELEMLNYGFVGGWGIRIGTKYGTVYNVSGNIGLRIKQTNGKSFLIGTQKEKELKAVVEKWKNISS